MPDEGDIEDVTDDWRSLGMSTQELFLVTPGLQVAHHPNPAMIGARLRFVHFGDGAKVHVSRQEGLFNQRGWAKGRPLDVRRLSRAPLVFTPGAQGAVTVSFDANRSEVEANGAAIESGVVFDRSSLEDGVVLLLNRTVALILHLQSKWRPDSSKDYGLVGESMAMYELQRQIGLAMVTERPILLLGASGTGKELVATALHQGGNRAGQPFVAVNMATIPSDLATSELFGHERGAFSGATSRRQGLFQRANGGTLFLDEVGDTNSSVQSALLRALETSEVRPIGSEHTTRVDCRFIAATDADIHASDEFKSALIARLGIELRLPSLAARREDVPLLLHHFLREQLGQDVYEDMMRESDKGPWLPPWLTVALVRHEWPRNVRELRNVAREIAVFSQARPFQPGPMVTRICDAIGSPESAEASSPGPAGKTGSYRAREDVSPEELKDALLANAFGVAQAARQVGLSQQSMYRAMEEHGILYAKQLNREQFLAHYEQNGCNLAEMSRRIQVSHRALKLRKAALNID